MDKKVLSEQSLFYGDVAMPKDWDIDRNKLSGDILQSVIQNKDFPFSKTWDMLNTYMRDHIGLEYDIKLINKSRVDPVVNSTLALPDCVTSVI